MLNRILLTTALVSISLPAAAQFRGDAYYTLDRTETVTERIQPDFAPRGYNTGGFVLFPSVTVDQVYDDNILAADTNE
ncbi:MAG: hypothetical protein WBF53_13100, partial [Litorimonas sp.]